MSQFCRGLDNTRENSIEDFCCELKSYWLHNDIYIDILEDGNIFPTGLYEIINNKYTTNNMAIKIFIKHQEEIREFFRDVEIESKPNPFSRVVAYGNWNYWDREKEIT